MTASSQTFKALEQLLDSQDYFRLSDLVHAGDAQLKDTEELYFQAMLDNVFHRPATSVEKIKGLLQQTPPLPEKLVARLLQTLLLNHIQLHQYGEAATVSRVLQNEYSESLDASQLPDLENELLLWNALKDIPPQSISRSGTTRIPLYRDKVGLQNIEVRFGRQTKRLIFDTGANFSVLTRSSAEQLGLDILPAGALIRSSTGQQVAANLAVAGELSIGALDLRHVVFLVFEDRDLSFPQADYYPSGAIGFPVIRAMEEIRICKDGHLEVPETPLPYGFGNFAMDGLMPIVKAGYRDADLCLHLDTGATRTSLYSRFLETAGDGWKVGSDKKMLRSTGAGGSAEFEGYVLQEIRLRIADKEAVLKDVKVHRSPVGGKQSNFHGNLGQDLIRQFRSMTLGFKDGSVVFTPE